MGSILLPNYPLLLWEGRRWLLLAVVLFVAGSIVGFAAAVTHPALTMMKVQPAVERIREMSEHVLSSGSPVQRAMLIFVNNVLVVYLMLEGGILGGVLPGAALLLNGGVMGVVIGLGTRLSPVGASPLLLLASVVPHGIFELPAMWFGGAWGMRLGLRWLTPSAAGQRKRVLGRSVLEAGQVFVLVGVLLLVAAFVEGNITLALTRALRG